MSTEAHLAAKKSHHHIPQGHTRHKKHPWVPRDPAKIPQTSLQALRQAMALEQVNVAEFDDLAWIMAQESEGKVNNHNPHSSARGLFQLLKDQYHYYPHGEKSLGNAVEEAQGGIRYIKDRYGSASSARSFWEKHKWY